ncbi:hypothetical protein [Salinimonas chungwhensis]|uniref:hypothetical protein n=1 Tax=Salinimonas chungwhensis TaxID=265425 RepID=UPI00035E87EA|nr:hypothetical protein [Salinimonas chungwhensis]
MRQLLLAILIALVLVSGLGSALWEWLDISVYFSESLLSPLENLLLFLVLAVVFVVVGFIVAVSVVGAVVISLMAGAAGLLVFGISMFWPVLVVAALVIAWRHHHKRSAERSNYGNSPYMQE